MSTLSIPMCANSFSPNTQYVTNAYIKSCAFFFFQQGDDGRDGEAGARGLPGPIVSILPFSYPESNACQARTEVNLCLLRIIISIIYSKAYNCMKTNYHYHQKEIITWNHIIPYKSFIWDRNTWNQIPSAKNVFWNNFTKNVNINVQWT